MVSMEIEAALWEAACYRRAQEHHERHLETMLCRVYWRSDFLITPEQFKEPLEGGLWMNNGPFGRDWRHVWRQASSKLGSDLVQWS